MSLINQVLKDLHRRGEGDLSRDALPASVHIAEKPAAGRGASWLWALALVAGGAAGGIWWARATAPAPVSSVPLAIPVAETPSPSVPVAAAPTAIPKPAASGDLPLATPPPVAKSQATVSVAPKKAEKPQARHAFMPKRTLAAAHKTKRPSARRNVEETRDRRSAPPSREARLPEDDRLSLLTQARRYAEDGELSRADRLLEDAPGGAADPAIAKLRAQILLKQGEAERAERVLERSPRADDPETDGILGAVRQRQGRHDEAVRLYGEAARRQPHRSQWLLGMAISLEAGERFDEALAAYRRALRLGAPSVQARAWAERRVRELSGER